MYSATTLAVDRVAAVAGYLYVVWLGVVPAVIWLGSVVWLVLRARRGGLVFWLPVAAAAAAAAHWFVTLVVLVS